jgi:hypothetical protein
MEGAASTGLVTGLVTEVARREPPGSSSVALAVQLVLSAASVSQLLVATAQVFTRETQPGLPCYRNVTQVALPNCYQILATSLPV